MIVFSLSVISMAV